MKLTKFTKFTAILFTGLFMISSSASAVTSVYNSDDLILGFWQDSNTNSYVLNIGQAVQYRTTASINLNTQAITDNSNAGTITGIGSAANIYSDMAEIFGAGWELDTTIHWAVVGTPGASNKANANLALVDPSYTLYASSTSLTPNSTYNRNLAAAQATPVGQILAMANQAPPNSYRGQTVLGAQPAGLLSPVGVKETSSTTNNFKLYADGLDTRSLTGAYNYFTGGTFSGTPDGSSPLNLFRIQASDADLSVDGGQGAGSGLGQLLGSFSIATSGSATDITWTASAVPEPGRAVLLMGGVASLFLRRRRPTATV